MAYNEQKARFSLIDPVLLDMRYDDYKWIGAGLTAVPPAPTFKLWHKEE
ncbi:MAG: hypothetical protein Q7J42_03845 [Sulfuritalea sp.]|nr:hypothetical protein [Sulfuritalea sp.]